MTWNIGAYDDASHSSNENIVIHLWLKLIGDLTMSQKQKSYFIESNETWKNEI